MKRKSHLTLLSEAINKWMQSHNINQGGVSDYILDAIVAIGLEETLAEEGITFSRSTDVLKRMRVNSQKLFRWLGHSNTVNASPERLFHMEQAIVAALPDDIRLDYLTEVYMNCGVHISVCNLDCKGSVDVNDLASALTKESSEALLAVLNLKQPSPKKLINAHRELTEARAIFNQAIEVLERVEDFQSTKITLKAVETQQCKS